MAKRTDTPNGDGTTRVVVETDKGGRVEIASCDNPAAVKVNTDGSVSIGQMELGG